MPEFSWWRSLRERMELLPVEPSQMLAGLVLVVVLAVGGVAWVAAGGGGRRGSSAAAVEASLPRAGAGTASSSSSVVSPPAGEVVVHVAGAVARPGLYRLPAGSRVADAVRAAGDAAADADLDRLNLAAPVADGERVYVPRRGEAEPVVVASGGLSPPGGGRVAPLDLNTATAEQLDALPGVGPSTAQAIVDYRSRHGPFHNVRELLEVRGIGEAKLAVIEKLVRV